MARWLLCTIFFLILPLFPASGQGKKKNAAPMEPRILLVVPLGAAPGKTTKLTVRGSLLENATAVTVSGAQGTAKILSKGKAGVPDKNPDQVGDTQVMIELKLNDSINGDTISLSVVTPTGETKPHPILIESKLPVLAEKEGNDGFRSAQPVVLPLVLEGSIQRPKDVDMVRFEGKKGQSIHAEVLASRYGSPLDAMLTLYDARGEQIAANDDFAKEHHDARIETTLPADGVYYLSLIDAHDAGSALHVYRLLVK